MKILLVDDHELFRSGIKLLLSDLADEIEFFEASDCAGALKSIDAHGADIVLLDFHMPGTQGTEAIELVRERAEAALVVVLSAEDDPALIRRTIEAGAAGFIPKSSSHKIMMAALGLVLAGGIYLPPHALDGATVASRGLRSINDPVVPGLTERQTEALRLAVQGKANKLIARELDLSEATVKAHLSAAFRALGVHNRTEAVFAAAKLGLKD